MFNRPWSKQHLDFLLLMSSCLAVWHSHSSFFTGVLFVPLKHVLVNRLPMMSSIKQGIDSWWSWNQRLVPTAPRTLHSKNVFSRTRKQEQIKTFCYCGPQTASCCVLHTKLQDLLFRHLLRLRIIKLTAKYVIRRPLPLWSLKILLTFEVGDVRRVPSLFQTLMSMVINLLFDCWSVSCEACTYIHICRVSIKFTPNMLRKIRGR